MSETSMKKGIAMNENELLEELSAFMDGELDAERSRFLMQRLAHDSELRARWERWQLQSGAMRRMAQPLPPGFADRVARAIDDQPAIVARPMARGLRWAGGVALAASLVVAATFVFDASHAPPATAPKVAVAQSAAPATVLPVTRTVLATPEPTIKLPIPVRSGVVTAFRLPLHSTLQRDPAQPQRPNFQPFPQPYAIDPELEAYLQDRKVGRTHDVFSENANVRTASWPVNQ